MRVVFLVREGFFHPPRGGVCACRSMRPVVMEMVANISMAVSEHCIEFVDSLPKRKDCVHARSSPGPLQMRCFQFSVRYCSTSLQEESGWSTISRCAVRCNLRVECRKGSGIWRCTRLPSMRWCQSVWLGTRKSCCVDLCHVVVGDLMLWRRTEYLGVKPSRITDVEEQRLSHLSRLKVAEPVVNWGCGCRLENNYVGAWLCASRCGSHARCGQLRLVTREYTGESLVLLLERTTECDNAGDSLETVSGTRWLCL